jgi:hypothetical protein
MRQWFGLASLVLLASVLGGHVRAQPVPEVIVPVPVGPPMPAEIIPPGNPASPASPTAPATVVPPTAVVPPIAVTPPGGLVRNEDLVPPSPSAPPDYQFYPGYYVDRKTGNYIAVDPTAKRKPLHDLLHHFNCHCWSSIISYHACGSLHSDCTFVFGSCRQFFSDTCVGGPEPLPFPPGGEPPNRKPCSIGDPQYRKPCSCGW